MKAVFALGFLASIANLVSGQALLIATRVNDYKCLTVQGNVNADGTPVAISDCTGVTGQRWTVDATYTVAGQIRIAGWNKCLDVTNGSSANGNKLQIWTCGSNNANQLFNYPTPNPALAIRWPKGGKCVDLTNGSTANGNAIQIWSCSNGDVNQTWDLIQNVVTSSGMRTSTTTTSTHSATPTPSTIVLRTGKDSTKCLAGSESVGGEVTIQTCADAFVQAWTYSGGTYSITFALPNSQHPTTQTLCLDVTNGSTANGNKLQMYTCSAGNANQQFTYTSDNRIARTNQHECVDLTGGNTAVGTQIQMWHCTSGDNNQVWNAGTLLP